MDQALKDLLERCKADDRSAQTALYRRFASKVFRHRVEVHRQPR